MLGEYFEIEVGHLLIVDKPFNVKRNHANDAFFRHS